MSSPKRKSPSKRGSAAAKSQSTPRNRNSSKFKAAASPEKGGIVSNINKDNVYIELFNDSADYVTWSEFCKSVCGKGYFKEGTEDAIKRTYSSVESIFPNRCERVEESFYFNESDSVAVSKTKFTRRMPKSRLSKGSEGK